MEQPHPLYNLPCTRNTDGGTCHCLLCEDDHYCATHGLLERPRPDGSVFIPNDGPMTDVTRAYWNGVWRAQDAEKYRGVDSPRGPLQGNCQGR